MYASLTTVRGAGPEVSITARMAAESMFSWLREFDGYRGLLVLGDPETGNARIISFWDSLEALDRSEKGRREVRDRWSPPPGRSSRASSAISSSSASSSPPAGPTRRPTSECLRRTFHRASRARRRASRRVSGPPRRPGRLVPRCDGIPRLAGAPGRAAGQVHRHHPLGLGGGPSRRHLQRRKPPERDRGRPGHRGHRCRALRGRDDRFGRDAGIRAGCPISGTTPSWTRSQVEDLRGRRVGKGGLAVGGGGIGLIVTLLIIFLGGNVTGGDGGLGELGDLADQTAGTPAANQEIAQECRTGADADQREDCRIVGYVNSVQAYWTTPSPPAAAVHARRTTASSPDAVETGCGTRLVGDRALLLPGRPLRLHRPRLLRRAALALRRAGRPVRAGLRDRARVRAPRPEPARRPRRPAGPGRGQPLGARRAPGGLLRRGLGAQRRRDRLPERLTQADIADAPRRRGGGRRRPDPGGSRRAASRPRAGRTAPRSSASTGSPPATSPATRAPATPSAGTSRSA